MLGGAFGGAALPLPPAFRDLLAPASGADGTLARAAVCASSASRVSRIGTMLHGVTDALAAAAGRPLDSSERAALLTERGGVGGDLRALRGAAVNIAEACVLMRELGGGARAPERVRDDDRDGADSTDARAPRRH